MISKVGRNLPMLFLLPKSIPQELEGPVFKVGKSLCDAMANVIGTDKVEGCQLISGTWRLVVKDFQSKAMLLAHGLSLAGYTIQCLGKSPYLIDGKESIKLILGNIPWETPDDDIKAALSLLGLRFGSELYWECYRDNDRKMSTFKSGRRFLYVARPEFSLPHTVTVNSKKKFKASIRLPNEYYDNDEPPGTPS